MTQDKMNKFRRCIERMRTMVEQRPGAMLPDARGLLLAWADELEAELDAEEVEQN
jgi:hypothetical protein